MSNRINSDCASPENSTDNNSNVEKMIGKMKFNMASNILMHAQNNGWESHEIANLITLLACELHLKGKKLLKFLMKVSLCNSEIISCLGDHGLIIKPIKILKTIIKKYSFSDFMHTLKSGLDQELFDTKDDRIIKYLRVYAENNLDPKQTYHLLYALCSNTSSLRECGKLLNIFCSLMLTPVAVDTVINIMQQDFVFELTGVFNDFLKEFPDISGELEPALRNILTINSKGRVVESDEDEDGNLKGFIEDDIDDMEEGGGGSDSDEDDDMDMDMDGEGSEEGSEGSEEEEEEEEEEERYSITGKRIRPLITRNETSSRGDSKKKITDLNRHVISMYENRSESNCSSSDGERMTSLAKQGKKRRVVESSEEEEFHE